jgi:NRAMP (natural resistance-associated macrophage protein)-like metal ion transporter
MESVEKIVASKKRYSLKEKIRALGPGILVVGSFIGPGTVTSATKAGAGYGYALLWTVIFSTIAVIVLQGMAARLGIVKQNGFAEELVKELNDKPVAKWTMIGLVASAIVLGGVAYMGGDLTGTAIGISALTGIPSNIIAPIWGLLILLLVSRGNAIKSLEKLLTVCVSTMAVVFIVTMIVVKPDVASLFQGTIPSVPDGALFYCIALIGTTVVPYNLFIHATSASRTWKTAEEIPLSTFDIGVSMTIGGIITGAVMITAAATMRGLDVKSAADMAIQLQPLLGSLAKPFLSIGLVAAGVSSAVITPLGVSIVLAGLFGWKMDRSDKRFFWTNTLVLIFGIIVAATGFNPLTIIMMAQAINGAFLPVIVIALVYITSRKRVLGEHRNGPIQIALGVAISMITLVIGASSIISLF